MYVVRQLLSGLNDFADRLDSGAEQCRGNEKSMLLYHDFSFFSTHIKHLPLNYMYTVCSKAFRILMPFVTFFLFVFGAQDRRKCFCAIWPATLFRAIFCVPSRWFLRNNRLFISSEEYSHLYSRVLQRRLLFCWMSLLLI